MNEIGRLPCAWARYDDVAQGYEHCQAFNGYDRLARDLVIALKLTLGASLLDVGCGSGAVTLAAQHAVGIHGFVVGLEISLPMLRRASTGGAAHLVAGIFPGLPFRDGCFNTVAASLVLSHVERYEIALRDMVRVLKPGGRLGVSAWAQSPKERPNIAYRAWEETAESLVGSEALREALSRNSSRFRVLASLRAASRESPFSGGSITTTAEPRDVPERREPHGPMCG